MPAPQPGRANPRLFLMGIYKIKVRFGAVRQTTSIRMGTAGRSLLVKHLRAGIDDGVVSPQGPGQRQPGIEDLVSSQKFCTPVSRSANPSVHMPFSDYPSQRQ